MAEDQAVQSAGATLSEASRKPILSRIQRVAIFLMLLEDEEAAALMARMEPDELEVIGATMLEVGEISRDMMIEALIVHRERLRTGQPP